MDKNHAALIKRWGHYLKVRKMDYPIVIRRKAAIGDVLLTTPVIRQLRHDKPQSPVMIITDFPELFWKNADVTTASKQMQIPPDALTINLDMAYENRPMTHIIDSYAEVSGVKVQDYQLSMPIEESRLEWGKETVKDVHKPRAVIAPGPTTWQGKNWTLGGWAAVCNYLKQKGFAVMVIGSHAGVRNYELGGVLDFRGKTDIHQSAALLSMSDLFVGVDSFPLHLAMSQRVPAVGLFGVTYPDFILSSGICITCQASEERYPEIGSRHRQKGTTFTESKGECMRAITIDQVIAAIDDLRGML